MRLITIKAMIITIALFCAVKTNAQKWNGLTLYSNSGSSIGYLIDTNNTVVKTWNFTGGGTGYSTHLAPGGDLYRTVSISTSLIGGGMTGKIQRWSYAGVLLWDYTYSSTTYCMHHDHCVLPNGNVLIISYDVKSAATVTANGGTNNIIVWAEKILELQPTGLNTANIVWQWNVWDHLVQNVNSNLANYQTSIVNNPQLLNINYASQKDWMHMNGIDYNPILDQIVVSSHNLNEWYIIDHSTTTAQAATHSGGNAGKGGDFLYRWGNPFAYQAAGSTILNVTHDSHWIPEGSPNAGYLVGINNKGQISPSTKTCVDQILSPRTNYNYTINAGSAYTPASYLNRHLSSGYTSNMGSSDQFPNGNQMICLATAGTIYEINSAGTVVWTKSTGGTTPQSHRYTTCYINNAAPSQPVISYTNPDLISTPGTTYQWYFNGDLIVGATSQTYTPSQYGIYVVRTTDANGCVNVYSKGFDYTMVTSVKTQNNTLNSLMIFPNPTTGNIELDFNGYTETDFTVSIFDNTGKLVLKSKNEVKIDMSDLNTGLYILNIAVPNKASVNKKITLIK
ncbi:MAG: aryl-sulfate sulfotransferase [Bacteroidetes bacterium]|nr:aryl-sulfate sulfotransferase [Bacteroidota bacterium]